MWKLDAGVGVWVTFGSGFDGAIGSFNNLVCDKGDVFQRGIYLRKDKKLYRFHSQTCNLDGVCCRGHRGFAMWSVCRCPFNAGSETALGLFTSIRSASVVPWR